MESPLTSTPLHHPSLVVLGNKNHRNFLRINKNNIKYVVDDAVNNIYLTTKILQEAKRFGKYQFTSTQQKNFKMLGEKLLKISENKS